MITAAFIIAKAMGMAWSWWWLIASFAGDCILADIVSNKQYGNILKDDED